MFRKILCATDFSPGSEHALRVAIRLANNCGAELVIGHAWYVPSLAFSGDLPFPASVLDEIVADEQRALAQSREYALRLGAKKLSTIFMSGLPWERLCGAVEDDPAIDLVVMGTHGRSGLQRFLLGSVAEKVVRHSPCSVLAVRGSGDGIDAFHHVLCPVDFSRSSTRAVALAAQLADPDGEGITLFHALDVPVRLSGELELDFVATVDRRAAELLEGWAVELRAKTRAPVKVRSRIGNPATEAVTVLESETSYDLACVGSHGRKGLARVLLGSVAEKIVRHAPCPILVAREREAQPGS